jgi:hypothetical protein
MECQTGERVAGYVRRGLETGRLEVETIWPSGGRMKGGFWTMNEEVVWRLKSVWVVEVCRGRWA